MNEAIATFITNLVALLPNCNIKIREQNLGGIYYTLRFMNIPDATHAANGIAENCPTYFVAVINIERDGSIVMEKPSSHGRLFAFTKYRKITAKSPDEFFSKLFKWFQTHRDMLNTLQCNHANNYTVTNK
jgi:hypothetical protein